MAEGLLRKHLGDAVSVQSCGLTPEDPNGFMISVMNEVGIDMSAHTPSALEERKSDHFDRVIAFTDTVKKEVEDVLGQKGCEVELWAVPNPGEGSLDVRAILNNYRVIRSDITALIKREFT